jgi:hypothetical protein
MDREEAAAAGAKQESVSFLPEDEAIYRKFFRQEGLKRTDFVRAAIRNYNNRFEWEKTREEVQRVVEAQFLAFVERFGTRAEQERDSLRENQSQAAALTLLLYKHHLFTLHIRALLDHVGFHPRFNASDDTMKAGAGEFVGEWRVLLERMHEKILTGDQRLIAICDRIMESAAAQDAAVFDIFEDITPLYNNAATSVVLAFMKNLCRAAEEMSSRERRGPG